MAYPRLRVVHWALVAALIGTTGAVLAAKAGKPAAPPKTPIQRASLEDGKPMALAKHLERLKEAIPGNGGESVEGPGSAEDQAFALRAYPLTDIPLAQIQGARSAAAAVGGRNFPSGKGRPGTWVSVGPSNAVYPAPEFRSSFSYVPNEYVAGGRTTSIAISPNCDAGQCTIWVGPAGGGIWRTKNALNGQPNWKFLSGPFGISAVGAIALDPNDPSGSTLWVGTGEANASGDSAAGVGLYKSTDGGDTWTGPIGQPAFDARAVGTIAVKAGDPDPR